MDSMPFVTAKPAQTTSEFSFNTILTPLENTRSAASSPKSAPTSQKAANASSNKRQKIGSRLASPSPFLRERAGVRVLPGFRRKSILARIRCALIAHQPLKIPFLARPHESLGHCFQVLPARPDIPRFWPRNLVVRSRQRDHRQQI